MIVKTLLLPITPEAAFELFTRRIDNWWPPERRHAPSGVSQIFLERNGRFYERDADNREFDLGRVREWSPPTRLVLDFFIASGADRPTLVEISFEKAADGAQVTIAHKASATSEAVWPTLAPRYAESWDAVLSALARAAA